MPHSFPTEAHVDLSELQRAADAMLGEMPDGYWPPLANLARLTEEVGEFARALNQRVGPKRLKAGEQPEDIALEMGDILFTLAVMANQLGIDLGQSAADALRKYRRRDLGGREEAGQPNGGA